MKLTSNMIWDMAQAVAAKVDSSDAENLSKAELIKIDSRCCHLIETPSQYDGKDYDEDQTLDYFLTLVKFHKAARNAGYRVDREFTSKENLVYGIVNGIFVHDQLNENRITDIVFEDGCIQLKVIGYVTTSCLVAIGKAFGCESPDVHAEGENLFNIVFKNNVYENLNK